MKSLIPWKKRENAAAPSLWDDDWFDRGWEDSFRSFPSLFSGTTRFSPSLPSVDVSEDKTNVTVRAELPGMTEKDVDLTWINGILRIRGEKKEEKEEKKKNRYFSECRYGCFSRDIPLGDSVEFSQAKASFKHGVLTVKLPKTEHARKSIDIKVQ